MNIVATCLGGNGLWRCAGPLLAALPASCALAAAEADWAAAPSRQVTQTALWLVALMLLAMLGFGLWSWRRRRALAARRREAELARRTAEARLRDVTDRLPMALFQYHGGAAPGFDYLSEGLARLLPLSVADLQAAPARLLSLVHADDRAGLAWLGGGETVAAHDWLGRAADGQGGWRWLQLRASAGLSAEGQQVVSGVLIDVSDIKAAEQALAASRTELRRLAAHRERRVEQERQRLAREFHDELGQVLTAARMQVQLLRREAALAAGPAAKLATLEDLLGEAYRSVKGIASDLRPAALNLGLTAAVEWLAERLLKPAGIVWRLDFCATADELPEETAIVLFRVVQESVSNIVRHAGAREVRLRFAEDGARHVLCIADDGCGFDPAAVDRRAHFGLLGLAERAAALGGTLAIDSRPGAGTTLCLEMPTS